MLPVAAGPADWATSAAMAAPRGSTFWICRISELSSACGALITMALSAGMPSERATLSETTASTPPIPTVPRPASGRSSTCRPVTWTSRPSGSLSSLPIV